MAKGNDFGQKDRDRCQSSFEKGAGAFFEDGTGAFPNGLSGDEGNSTIGMVNYVAQKYLHRNACL